MPSRSLLVSPTTSPVRLGVSPAAAPTPRGVFNQRFEALFLPAGALGCVVCLAPPHLSGLSVCECGVAGSASGQTACPVCPTLRQSRSPVLVPPWQLESSTTRLPVSTPPTGLDECLFFYLLGVGLPCRLIFCQFWLCEEAQCVYLCRHLGSPRAIAFNAVWSSK